MVVRLPWSSGEAVSFLYRHTLGDRTEFEAPPLHPRGSQGVDGGLPGQPFEITNDSGEPAFIGFGLESVMVIVAGGWVVATSQSDDFEIFGRTFRGVGGRCKYLADHHGVRELSVRIHPPMAHKIGGILALECVFGV